MREFPANKQKQMKTNERKIAFISFQKLFRIGTFQWVTADSNKKIPSAISGCARRSEVNSAAFVLSSPSTVGFDPATANGIARSSLFTKIKSEFCSPPFRLRWGPRRIARRGWLAGEKHAVCSHVICASESISISGGRRSSRTITACRRGYAEAGRRKVCSINLAGSFQGVGVGKDGQEARSHNAPCLAAGTRLEQRPAALEEPPGRDDSRTNAGRGLAFYG
jgi:hypothetical protein